MVNLQDYIEDSRLFKTYRADELLFVEYKCLVTDERSAVWSHNNYFAFPFGGKKKWITQKREYLVEPGDAVFVKKGATTVYQYFEEPFFVLFIFMPDRFLRKMLSKYPDALRPQTFQERQTDTVIPIEVNQPLEAYFHSLFSYFLQAKPPPEELLRLKMEELVLTFFAQPENLAIQQYLASIGQSQKADLKAIMEANFAEALSINDYARLCTRSLSTFRRDFKKTYGMPPGKWLLQKRLEFSRLLLKTSNAPVTEIAYQSGFKNRNHFLKAFKNSEGVTPTFFRKRWRKAAPTT